MRDVLLSIRPEYAAMIYARTKSVEFRRGLPDSAKDWKRFYIYESSPVRMVTGWADVSWTMHSRVDVVWRMFPKDGGIGNELCKELGLDPENYDGQSKDEVITRLDDLANKRFRRAIHAPGMIIDMSVVGQLRDWWKEKKKGAIND